MFGDDMNDQISVQLVATMFEAFLQENFDVDLEDEFYRRQVNLWEEGFVDSAGVVEVIEFLEETYGMEMPDDLLFDPRFTSVDGIAELIANLLRDLDSGQAELVG